MRKSLKPPRGTHRPPEFERARVSDAMWAGVITCTPDTPLKTVAQMMATNRVHCVVVMGPGWEPSESGELWGVVSDRDVIAAGADAEDRCAAGVCTKEVVTVGADDTIDRAAQLMTEHDTAHLIVVSSATGSPVGVISTMDIAGVIAWGRP